MRFDAARNKIYWSNEGRRGLFSFRPPTVTEMNPDGSHSRVLPSLPIIFPRVGIWEYFPGNTGIHNNLAFESLAISTDGTTLYTATENGLIQDSPPANAFTGSRARILAFDIASGRSERNIYTRSSPLPKPQPCLTVCNQWLDRFYRRWRQAVHHDRALFHTRCGHPRQGNRLYSASILCGRTRRHECCRLGVHRQQRALSPFEKSCSWICRN